MKIFGKLELSKLTFIPKFHWNPITITKVTAFLSYCSNFCQKSAKNGQNFLKFFGEFYVPKSNIPSKFGQFLTTVTLKKQQSLRRTTTRTTTRRRTRTRVILKPCMRRVKKLQKNFSFTQNFCRPLKHPKIAFWALETYFSGSLMKSKVVGLKKLR